ncbi:MAG TPA: OstA-like protein [bacterium]|jgi:lipopolysaccharide export system protein LptA
MIRRLLLAMLCFAALLGAGLASGAAERTPIVLNRARTLVSSEENGKRKQELQGDVEITKDSLIVTCQNAEYYPDSGIVIFRDDVVFKTPHRILMADQVIYNENTEEVHASNRVRVYQGDTLSATSRTADYFDRLKAGYLYDEVNMREDNRRVLLTGQKGFGDNDRKYGWVTGNPVATERDSTMKIISQVHGDTIEYFGDTKLMRVRGKVRVDRDSLVATGTALDYFTQEHYAVLVGGPEAMRSNDHVKGDTIRLYFEKEKEALDSVEVSGHALVTSPADSTSPEPLNRMEGKHMTLYLDKGAISKVLVQGTAVATYYVREKAEKRGMNITSGDRLWVFFEDRKIARIRVEGGTEGQYTPQRLVSKPAS